MKVVLIVCIVILFAVIVGLLIYLTRLSATHNKQRSRAAAINGGYTADAFAHKAQAGGTLYGEHSKANTQPAGANFMPTNSQPTPVILGLTNYATKDRYEKMLTDSIVVRRGTIDADAKTLCIPDPRISHRHCAFVLERGAVFVEDLGSTNHTYVNYNVVAGLTRVWSGDIVSLGNIHFIVDIN